MKKTPDKKICILTLAFILLLGIANTHARVVTAGFYEVLLIGTVIAPHAKGNSRTFELRYQEDKWSFKVTEAHELSGASLTGWKILTEIFPRKIRLLAEKGVTEPLRQPRIVGKAFKLKGKIYVGSRTMHLDRVEEVVE